MFTYTFLTLGFLCPETVAVVVDAKPDGNMLRDGLMKRWSVI